MGRRGAGNEADVCFCRIVIISGVSHQRARIIERNRELSCCPLHPFRTNILSYACTQILISLRPDNLKNNSKDMTDVKVKTVKKVAPNWMCNRRRSGQKAENSETDQGGETVDGSPFGNARSLNRYSNLLLI